MQSTSRPGEGRGIAGHAVIPFGDNTPGNYYLFGK
jgi:hypothetical protein